MNECSPSGPPHNILDKEFTHGALKIKTGSSFTSKMIDVSVLSSTTLFIKLFCKMDNL